MLGMLFKKRAFLEYIFTLLFGGKNNKNVDVRIHFFSPMLSVILGMNISEKMVKLYDFHQNITISLI